MMFLTLDDGTGLAECTFFPEGYRRAAPVLAGDGPFVAVGRVASQYGALNVVTERVERGSSYEATPLANAAASSSA
jgi:DNA polymerase III alpha subunit